MKRILGLLTVLLLLATVGNGQIVCPPHVPHFDFYFQSNVTLGQKVGGVTYCEPDTLQSDVWTIQDPSGLFTIEQDGDIVVIDPATVILNGTEVYNMMVLVTDNGTPPLTNFSTVTLYATKPNEPPVILPQ